MNTIILISLAYITGAAMRMAWLCSAEEREWDASRT